MQIPQDIEFWMYYEANAGEKKKPTQKATPIDEDEEIFFLLFSVFLFFSPKLPLVVNKVIRGRLKSLHVNVRRRAYASFGPDSELLSSDEIEYDYAPAVCLFTSFLRFFFRDVSTRKKIASRPRLSDRIMILSDPVWSFGSAVCWARNECLMTFLIPKLRFIIEVFLGKDGKIINLPPYRAFWWL